MREGVRGRKFSTLERAPGGRSYRAVRGRVSEPTQAACVGASVGGRFSKCGFNTISVSVCVRVVVLFRRTGITDKPDKPEMVLASVPFSNPANTAHSPLVSRALDRSEEHTS